MASNHDNRKKDLAYYLTLFKLEGHSTWRAHLAGDLGGFEREQKNWANGIKVTEKVVMRIDRLTGGFAQAK